MCVCVCVCVCAHAIPWFCSSLSCLFSPSFTTDIIPIQLKDSIDFTDVSTPLSIEHYLASPRGAAVGLDPSPLRFGGNMSILKHFDTVTSVPNLYLTGQDSLLCGVVMAQIAGLATALRVGGLLSSVRFVLQNLFW